MKLGTLIQNNMWIAVMKSKSKPETQFQYGGHFFFSKMEK